MKGKRIQIFLIKSGIFCLAAGICSILAALIFYKKGESETIWLIIFSAGAILVLFWLFVSFFIGRCRLCGSFMEVRLMTMNEGHYYCRSCGEMIKYTGKDVPPTPGKTP